METDVCIVGAGPAGLTAAIFAAQKGAQTTVIEGNTTAGRKLLRTGGGRCNLTHCDNVNDLIAAYGPGGRFLRYCLHEFPPRGVMQFFSERGLETEVEKDGCVFPVSGRAADVRDILLAEAKRLGVQFLYDRTAERVSKSSQPFFEVRTLRQTVNAAKVIIATGGVSWPDTGSTGAGYHFARELGHTIIEPRGALVPLLKGERWVADLAGTALENVKISTTLGKKKTTVRGPMLFTQDGIGGPAPLDLSRLIADLLPESAIQISVDMVVGCGEQVLDEKIVRLCAENPRKTMTNILSRFVPRRLAAALCGRLDIGETQPSQLSKQKRRKLVGVLKALPLTITGARPINEAMVTHGGVSTRQIEAKTMQSTICAGLFFAGEVIDVDGPCGGYNLQICWSTGALAGRSAATARPARSHVL
ncbi:MAG TPA: NAD(P)/FAD-dependent oxidoreductase [Sedimentisphaerales bacterium]|nr:NAD(P)/FAD-dependent oxidoreductase [Sedimentisphaerales bacterium]